MVVALRSTHVNEVTLRRAGLVLGWVTVHKYTILEFSQPLRPTQPGHPSVCRRSEYWRWSLPLLGKKGQVLHNSRPCYQECWHSQLKALSGSCDSLHVTGFNPLHLKVPNKQRTMLFFCC